MHRSLASDTVLFIIVLGATGQSQRQGCINASVRLPVPRTDHVLAQLQLSNYQSKDLYVIPAISLAIPAASVALFGKYPSSRRQD